MKKILFTILLSLLFSNCIIPGIRISEIIEPTGKLKVSVRKLPVYKKPIKYSEVIYYLNENEEIDDAEHYNNYYRIKIKNKKEKGYIHKSGVINKNFDHDRIENMKNIEKGAKGFSEDETISAAAKGFSEDELVSAASKGFSEDSMMSAAAKGFSEDETISAATKGFNAEVESIMKERNLENNYIVLDYIDDSIFIYDKVNPTKRMINFRKDGRLGEYSPYYNNLEVE